MTLCCCLSQSLSGALHCCLNTAGLIQGDRCMGKILHSSLGHTSTKPCKCGGMFRSQVVLLAHSFTLPLSASLSTPYPSPIVFLSASFLTPHPVPLCFKLLAICKTQPPFSVPLIGNRYLSSLVPNQEGFNEIQYVVTYADQDPANLHIHTHTTLSLPPSSLPCLSLPSMTLLSCHTHFLSFGQIYLAQSKHSPDILQGEEEV